MVLGQHIWNPAVESTRHFPSRPFLPWRGWGRGCRNVCSIFHSLREDVPGNRGRIVLWEASGRALSWGRDGQEQAEGCPTLRYRGWSGKNTPLSRQWLLRTNLKLGGGGGGKVTGKAVSVEVLFANGVLVKCTLKCLRNQTHSQRGQDAAHSTAHAQRNGARHAKHREATDRVWLLTHGLGGPETEWFSPDSGP